jgi:hypothetical protein
MPPGIGGSEASPIQQGSAGIAKHGGNCEAMAGSEASPTEASPKRSVANPAGIGGKRSVANRTQLAGAVE